MLRVFEGGTSSFDGGVECELSRNLRFGLRTCTAVLVGTMIGFFGRPASARAGNSLPGNQQNAPAASMSNGKMAHMYMTSLRPPKSGDQQKADAIVASAKTAMAPYQDYRKALADGFVIFLPNIPQPQYHFTKGANGIEARQRFDPLKPTSLLYKKTAGGGYKLVGVMYTDRVDASEEELNERIPLSVARWHQHINFCKAPLGKKARVFWPTCEVWPDGFYRYQGSL